MKLLVLNCGSSSLKYRLFEMADETLLARGLVDRIGLSGSRLTHEAGAGSSYVRQEETADHREGLRLVFEALTGSGSGVLERVDEIEIIGHRVAHGGSRFTGPALVDTQTKDAIRQLIELAPLHNPANLLGIEACEEMVPGVFQVAVFDTAFHQTMPPKSYIYGLPYRYFQKYGIRKYGFHGISHKYVSCRAAALLGRQLEELKIISCHLGNGASITAVQGGRSVDTSMGFTPLEGLTMGTRCGDLDPAVVAFLVAKERLSAADVTVILNRESGVLGISGLSSDFRDLQQAAATGHERARLAIEVFVQDAKKYIGAYTAKMNGVDALVFTAGLGENSPLVRESICRGLDCLGIQIDRQKNKVVDGEADISAEGSRARVLVIPTNEELMIARDARDLALALEKS